MKTLQDVCEALKNLLNNDGNFSMLNSRLILRTGINLAAPRPAHVSDPVMVQRAVMALQQMGFALQPRGEKR